ncbi:MAG: hypothetical protein K2L93_06355 [Muribaculaceae bacterium]|nr:hypothetical protein [Muribaculaceae bacterium]MDE6321907.1 hypothetical protein [Muribaculaceae bacterium]
MRKLLLLVAVAVLAVPLMGKRPVTLPARSLKPRAEYEVNQTSANAMMHVAAQPGDFDIAGYDKPLKSRRETMLVTNLTDHDVDSLYITIDYRDLKGRQLHQRSLWAKGEIPVGETRLIEVRAWDVQGSYVYRYSAKPRSLHTPYDVTVTIDSVAVIDAKNRNL